MSASSTQITKVNLAERKVENEKYIAEWKSTHGVMKQSKLQSKSEAFTAWVLSQGWSLKDQRSWSALLESSKMEMTLDEGWPTSFALIADTLDLACTLNVHPIGILSYSRVELGMAGPWNQEALLSFRSRVLPSEEDDDVDRDDESTESYESEGQDGMRTPSPTLPTQPDAPRKRARVIDLTDDEVPLRGASAASVLDLEANESLMSEE